MNDEPNLPGKQVKNIRGQRFSRLTVLAYAGTNNDGEAIWRCFCDCGNTVTVRGGKLRSGHTGSCGCLMREATSRANATHRMIGTPEYRSWAHIKSRCTNPNVPAYQRYGGRGITMCDRWLMSFETFYADMGPRPSPAHSIERIDNSGPYSPENCKWADRVEQANNKRNNHLISHNGVTQTLPVWARQLGIPYSRLKHRLRSGMSIERAFSPNLLSTRSAEPG